MTQNKPFVLGLTGPAGTGKSVVLTYLKERWKALVLECDAIARSMQMPGGECYKGMIDLLGPQIVLPDKTLDRSLMARILFEDRELMEKVNQLVHPAVKRYVDDAISRAAAEGVSLAAVESAILVQSGFSGICDEVWYIHADRDVRRRRLKAGRGYDDDRIDAMMAAQEDETYYIRHAARIIDNNSDDTAVTFEQIDRGLENKWNFAQ